MIKIFDTTLRDGEQSPGCSMNLKEKLLMAKQLEHLNVDIIEAGFAISSKGDFESVREISKAVKNPIVASLSRSLQKDIDIAWEAVKYANRPRIHVFLATSPIHMKYKLSMSEEKVLEMSYEAVKYAKKFCSDIEFSAEDATRSDVNFLIKVFEGVIKAGATVINVPDTVGYITPQEYFNLIKTLKENVTGIDKVDISVHCHDDLGMAVANSLSAVKAGATQVECTVNGIGERAGNAALEEIVMAIKTRKDFYEHETNIVTAEIMKTSKLLSSITGVKVQPNKAIVGENAFAHESGIHQHGVLAEKSTYEVMDEGISMIHQELHPVRFRPVMENVWLGRFPSRFGVVDHRAMYERTRELFRDLDLDVDPAALAGSLSAAKLQMMEIARAVSTHARIIIMDEPTSSLTDRETEHLFRIIDRLRKEDIAVIYISHKMEEILRISDEVSIMRDGHYVGT